MSEFGLFLVSATGLHSGEAEIGELVETGFG